MPRLIFKDVPITEDNQAFTFADLVDDYLQGEVTLPDFTLAPTVSLLYNIGDAIVNLHPDFPPTADGFTVIVGSAGQVPSEANPILFGFELISNDEEETEPVGAGLVAPAWVKERFPQWQVLCTRADNLKTADEMLIIAIEEASIQFSAFYEDLTADDMTDEYRIHLLRMIKHVIFGFKHGDSEFKIPPQIEKDYDATIKLLHGGLIGTGNIVMTAKDRDFEEGEWFTDEPLTADNPNA